MKITKFTRIIALLLCVITVAGLVVGLVTSNPSTNTNQSTVSDVLGPKKRLTSSQIAEVVEKNKSNDYSLETLLSIFGNPGAMTVSFDGTSVTNYSSDADIEFLLETYPNAMKKESLIQLMWMDEQDDLVFTVIATDYEKPTIVGIIKQSLKSYSAGSEIISTTEHHLYDFEEYTTETLENFEDAFVSSIQYPLLECYYTKKNVATSDYSATWTTKIVQNDMGLIYLLLKNDKPYQMYQECNSKDLPTYDKSEKLKPGMSERQFLNVYPDAVRIQLFNHEENEQEYYIVSYALKEKDAKGKASEMIYHIVDDDLYIYDEKGELLTPDNSLIIEKNTGTVSSSASDDTNKPEDDNSDK